MRSLTEAAQDHLDEVEFAAMAERETRTVVEAFRRPIISGVRIEIAKRIAKQFHVSLVEILDKLRVSRVQWVGETYDEPFDPDAGAGEDSRFHMSYIYLRLYPRGRKEPWDKYYLGVRTRPDVTPEKWELFAGEYRWRKTEPFLERLAKLMEFIEREEEKIRAKESLEAEGRRVQEMSEAREREAQATLNPGG